MLIDKKRIAKNTIMLYIRMILITLVTLYTSRIVLEVLGVEDYGIYNVVGGIVVMLGFLNSAMSSATQRYLSFELGRDDDKQLKTIFSTSVIIHIIIALMVLILAETVGLWFLNYKMVIPLDRMEAANWVFQFAILTFITKIVSVPYYSSIISYEKMNVFAYISILEVLLQLGMIFILKFINIDRLELYSVLVCFISLIITSIYRLYCVKKISICRLHFVWDKRLIREMLFFSGWSLFGGLGTLAKFQGVNIILNIFFGAFVNAAWGIAQQVNSAILLLISNFTTALNPPIIKSYACGDLGNTTTLLFNGMKYSFVLASCIIFPFLINTNDILDFWLKETPHYAIAFVQLVLICGLIDSILSPIGTVIQATGKVKWFQSIVGSISICTVPIAYIVFKISDSPLNIVYVLVSITVIAMLVRFIILYKQHKYEFRELYKLFSLMIIISLLNVPLFMFKSILNNSIIITSLSSVFIAITILFFYGMNKNEKKFFINRLLYIKNKLIR